MIYTQAFILAQQKCRKLLLQVSVVFSVHVNGGWSAMDGEMNTEALVFKPLQFFFVSTLCWVTFYFLAINLHSVTHNDKAKASWENRQQNRFSILPGRSSLNPVE